MPDKGKSLPYRSSVPVFVGKFHYGNNDDHNNIHQKEKQRKKFAFTAFLFIGQLFITFLGRLIFLFRQFGRNCFLNIHFKIQKLLFVFFFHRQKTSPMQTRSVRTRQKLLCKNFDFQRSRYAAIILS